VLFGGGRYKTICSVIAVPQAQCYVKTIYSAVNPETGEVKKPKCVGASQTASVVIVTTRPLCMEPFVQCRALGRFVLRSKGATVALGVVEKVSSQT
jgi:elongation factor 1 alpha-like protein